MANTLSSFNQQFQRQSKLSHSANRQSPQISCAIKKSFNSITKVFDCSKLCSNEKPLSIIKQYFPIFEWISKYKRDDLVPDFISGLTIAVFHIPECMGYSFLADVNPIYCLYTSLFPTLIYAIMGTSSYCSIGTFAALAIMIGSVVKETKFTIYQESLLSQSTADVNADSLKQNGKMADEMFDQDWNVESSGKSEQIAFVCAFIVGVYQLLFGLIRLGFVSIYMSEQFLNGFTCSVAYHVFCSQIERVLGLQVSNDPSQGNHFKLIKKVYQILANVPNINVPCLVISMTTLSLILISKWYIDPWIRKNKTISISFPIEFVIVISGVVVSRMMRLSDLYQVPIIGPIRPGLPKPSLPPITTLFQYVWQPCISIAVVSYSVTFSVGRTFSDQSHNNRKSKKLSSQGHIVSKKTNPSQELVALGCCNLIGSFLSCIPNGSSLSRSALQLNSGGRTQLVSIINSLIIMTVLYLTPFFETLPNTILATIILFALRGLLANICQFRQYWKINRVDATVWLVTFLSVLVIDINWGLYVGLVYSLLTLIYKSQFPPTYLLGVVNPEQSSSIDFFVPLKQYVNVRELPNVKIYQFCGPLHFANREYFVSQLESKLSISISDSIKRKSILVDSQPDFKYSTKNQCISNVDNLFRQHNQDFKTSTKSSGNHLYNKRLIPKYLVFDCSMISYIDTDGLKTLNRLIMDFYFLDVQVLISGCSLHVGGQIEKSFFENFEPKMSPTIYISVPDAIEHIRQQQQSSPFTKFDKTATKLNLNSAFQIPKVTSFPSGLNTNSLSMTELSLFSSSVSSLTLSEADSLIDHITQSVVIEHSNDYNRMSFDEDDLRTINVDVDVHSGSCSYYNI